MPTEFEFKSNLALNTLLDELIREKDFDPFYLSDLASQEYARDWDVSSILKKGA